MLRCLSEMAAIERMLSLLDSHRPRFPDCIAAELLPEYRQADRKVRLEGHTLSQRSPSLEGQSVKGTGSALVAVFGRS